MSYNLIPLLVIMLTSTLTGQYNIEELLSSPYASDLVKSEDGSVIAWVTNLQGKRAIYAHHINRDSTQLLYMQQHDHGQVLSDLQLDDSGRWLFYFEGSGTNRNGASANPSSLVNYPSRTLYRIALSTNIADTLGTYNRTIIAPSGEFILLHVGTSLFRMNPHTGQVKEVVKMRGNFGSIEIAKDEKSIVFVSQRGDHSFIGHFDFDSDHIEWLAPGVDNDIAPKWSPDDRQIAFIRMPGHQRDFLNNITAGIAFKIMVYSMATKSLDTLWTSPGQDGGFAQYYHAQPLRWTKTGKLVFYSEHEGYMKLYVLDPGNETLDAVIAGNCEVEHSDISPDGKELIFSSNCGDLDRRNIHIYDLEKRQIKWQTSGPSIETNPLCLTDETIAYLKGTYNLPTAVYLYKDGERLLSNGVEPDFPQDQLIEPEAVIFNTADGYTIHGQLFDNGTGSAKPGILFMHGGPIRQMLLGFHYSSYYANTYAFNQYLANQGYTVLSVNFRSGIGYGRDFRRAPHQGPRGASEYQDIVAAARFVQNLPQVDSTRIGLWGGSYGGFLTAMGLARNSDIFKAGVDFHGVHDWAWRAIDFSEGGFWGIGPDDLKLAYSSSPVADVDKWRSPVLFIHGDDDRNVMFGQTIDLVQKLRVRNIPHELLILPDEVHGFYRWESWLKSFETAARFFKRKL